MEPRIIPFGSLRIGHIVFRKQGNSLNVAGIVTELKVGRPNPKILTITTPLESTIRADKNPLGAFTDGGLCIDGQVYVINAFDCVSNTKIKPKEANPEPSPDV